MKKLTGYPKQLFFIIPVVFLTLSGIAFARSSTNYAIDFDVISGGGGGSSSTGYLFFDTLGQSSSRTFTVSNPGTGNLVIGDLSLTGDTEYSLPGINDHCSSAVLVPTGTCTFEVVFSPGPFSLGKKTATVSIPSNDPDSPMTVALEGRGVRLMVNPEEGTIGSLVSIGGSGFGTKKGKALLGTAALKVQTWGGSM